MQDKKQQLEPDVEQTGSKLEKEYVKVVYSHPVYLTYIQSAKSLQWCTTLCNPTDGNLPGFPRSWDSPGKNTGVGCHFLLQCKKVKNESEVAQLCPTLSDPMDCSLPGSSIHGIFQARVLEWGAIAFCYMHSTSCEMLDWNQDWQEKYQQPQKCR